MHLSINSSFSLYAFFLRNMNQSNGITASAPILALSHLTEV